MKVDSVTVVVPVYNEEGNVSQLALEIRASLEELRIKYEIIFVDDCSTDKTVEILENIDFIRFIQLRINSGQTAAIKAGIDHANMNYIILIDGDLQNDPRDFSLLISKLEADNLDCVVGWRKYRKDKVGKKVTSRIAAYLRKRIIPDHIHDAGCTLKLIPTSVAKEIEFYGELHRFITSLLVMKGFKVDEVVVNHRQRFSGVTKYNWRRTVKGYLDMIGLWFWNRYKFRPLHLFGAVGLFFIFAGFTTVFTMLISYFWFDGIFLKILPILSLFFLITGTQFLFHGLLSDYLIKKLAQISHQNIYNIRRMK